MMVSSAMAVLPVWRSPMINSRWPRPIGIMASIALMPVCSGSLTGRRSTTPGARRSMGLNCVVMMGPLSSMGLPRASTTRPINASPTGTDMMRPVRHLVVLHDKTPPAKTGSVVHAETDRIPSWVQDYALFLMDVDGRIVTWYSGAERIYGYSSDEAIGQHVSFLYPSEEVVRVNFE